jgi:4-carboxymuconolactone decarboxylase
MVTSPTLGRQMAAMGHAVRFENEVDNRLLELAICTVGAHWKSNFEFWAHSRLGIQAGLDQSVMDALAEGREPTFEREDERTVHAFASQLVSTGRVDQERYEATRDAVGEQGLTDLITTIGYYGLVSLTLNAHAVPLPGGQTPYWEI